MSENKKKIVSTDVTKEKGNEKKEIPMDKLDDVIGGGEFDMIPRVPEKPIDENLKDNI